MNAKRRNVVRGIFWLLATAGFIVFWIRAYRQQNEPTDINSLAKITGTLAAKPHKEPYGKGRHEIIMQLQQYGPQQFALVEYAYSCIPSSFITDADAGDSIELLIDAGQYQRQILHPGSHPLRSLLDGANIDCFGVVLHHKAYLTPADIDADRKSEGPWMHVFMGVLTLLSAGVSYNSFKNAAAAGKSEKPV
ncbi:hypothetical protein ACTHGU_05270 [Chitinophagaceae bacterium MMS25-I14]